MDDKWARLSYDELFDLWQWWLAESENDRDKTNSVGYALAQQIYDALMSRDKTFAIIYTRRP